MQYPLIFVSEDGEIVVKSRDFPELLTAGDTDAEATELAEDALAVVLLTYIEKGMALPPPRKSEPDERVIYVPAQSAAKIAVIQAFRKAGISKNELARRMGAGDNEARRVLDPNHGTKLEKLDAAARALGAHLVIGLAA